MDVSPERQEDCEFTLNALFHYCSALFVHSSLGGVLIRRPDEFEDEHKPQIWSGRTPCYDKDGNVKVLKDPPWYTDDWCHMSVCLPQWVVRAYQVPLFYKRRIMF